MKRKLLTLDAAEGGDLISPKPPTTSTPPPAPPPAAVVVANADISEREAQLQQEIKDREIRISQLEDENFRLTTPPAKNSAATEEAAAAEEDSGWAPLIR
jgi:hypothetical protein